MSDQTSLPTGLTAESKPQFHLDDLTWGDEESAMVANSVLLHADQATPEQMRTAFADLEGVLRRVTVAVPVEWVTDEARAMVVIEWSAEGMFKKLLKRKTFALLNSALFSAFGDSEKK